MIRPLNGGHLRVVAAPRRSYEAMLADEAAHALEARDRYATGMKALHRRQRRELLIAALGIVAAFGLLLWGAR